MLAKANTSGKGFSGKIDYLYEGKLVDRGSDEKKATVITHSDNIRVPYGFDDKKSRELMKTDFIDQAKQHKDYGNGKNSAYVGEHILSFTQEDRKKLNPENLKAITDEYVKMAGIDKTQFVAISHNDTDNLHVHILFNRAMDDGTKYKAWKEQNKTIERGIALALQNGFTLVKNQKEIANSKEVVQLRSEMQDIKDLRNSNEILGKARNMLHLEKICGTKNITLSKDELGKTVTMDNKTYQEADLKAVFLLNRTESVKTNGEIKNDLESSKPSKYKTIEASAVSETEMPSNSNDLKLKQQINTPENDFTKRPKKKKRQSGHQIKISKIEKKSEVRKGLSL